MSQQITRTRLFHFASAFAMLGCAFYSFIHLFLFLDITTPFKILGFLVCLSLSQCMPSMRYIVAFTPHMSYFALRVTGILSAYFMALVTSLMIFDILLFLFYIASILFQFNFSHYLPEIFSYKKTISIPIIALFLTLYGCQNALRCPRTTKKDLFVNNLPKELQGLQIVHLSDLHIGSTFDGKWLRELVKNINELNADLILITGDIVDGSPDKLTPDVIELKNLKAKYGVHISLGNHEFYCGAHAWIEKWRSWGLSVLVNENIRIMHNGFTFVLSAVADREGRKFKGMLRPDMSEALKDVTSDDFVIFMEHQPKNAGKNAKRGVNVQLSGHTHGGQYFLLFPLIKIMNGGFRTGVYYPNNMTLYVSPGTGLWGYAPLRVGSKNELTLLTLQHKI